MTEQTEQTTPQTKWTDATGRTWSAYIGIGLAEELKAGGLDLLDPSQLSALYQDPFALVKLNAEAHRKQIEAANLTAADFIELSTADERVARASLAALEAALESFFRRLRRGALAEVIRKASDAAAETDARQVAMLNTPQAAAAVAAEIARAIQPLEAALELATSGAKSGNAPES
jgi:pyridoxine 5'-phosphate synthase PdxJ